MKKVNIELNEVQLEGWLKLKDKETEIILLGSLANCGKSWLVGVWLLTSAMAYPGTRWGLGRKNLNDLKKTSLKTFLDVCKKYGVKIDADFKINFQSNTIIFKNGSEIHLLNLEEQPSDPDFDRLGGTEYTGVALEEIAQISQRAFEIIYSRIRYKLDEFKLKKKVLCTSNPSNNWIKSYFYDRYTKGILPDKISFITAVGKSNPYQGKDYLDSLSMLSETQYRRLVLGDWEYASNPDQLFNLDKLEDIFTPLQHGEVNNYYISADIARFGEDSSVILLWQDLTVIKIIKLDKSDTMNTAQEILKLMNEYKIPRNKVIVDSDGVGGGVMDKLHCKGFTNNAKPFKNEKYDNLKTQCYYQLSKLRWSVAENINSSIKEIIKRELESIRDTSNEDKYKINSKDEQKKLLGNKSPDYADALMMRMYFTYINNSVKLDFGTR